MPPRRIPHSLDLTRRERQVMDVIYARGSATAADIMTAIPDPPTYSGVRTILRVLVDKKHLSVTRDGARYVYAPRSQPRDVRRTALQHVIRTFFRGEPAEAMLALLDESSIDLDAATERKLRSEIARARRSGS